MWRDTQTSNPKCQYLGFLKAFPSTHFLDFKNHPSLHGIACLKKRPNSDSGLDWLRMAQWLQSTKLLRCLPQTPFLWRIIVRTFDLFCLWPVCGTMTLKLLFHKNSGREGSNNGETITEAQWTLNSSLLFCSDSVRQKQKRARIQAKERKKHRTCILLSSLTVGRLPEMNCCK